MNKIFKVIWNEARNAYVVVSEIAKNHGSKSCSTKKLLAMLIATGVMTCASFDVLAAPVMPVAEPAATETVASQYVALKAAAFAEGKPTRYNKSSWDKDFKSLADATKEWNAQRTYGKKLLGDYTYKYDNVNGYWVRAGYVLTVDENGGKYTQLSDNAIRADVAYTGTGVPEGILQSVTSTVARNGVVTHSGDSLQKVTAGSYAGVSNSGGTEVAGSWNYIINDSSWENSGAEYKDGYVDLVDLKGDKMPRGFKTTDSGLNWDEVKQTYTYQGKAVDYRNMYVIDGRLGVFTNYDGSEVYTGTVYGKHNEILMTVKDNGKFYSYWAASVTDPSVTMETYPVSKYNSDLAVIDKNIKDLNKDIIKEVTLTKGDDSAIIRLVRNGGKAVDGAITVTSGGGSGGSDAAHDTFVKISNGTTEQTFATGSKVEAIGSKDATTGIKINGEDYTIKSGSKVSVAQNDKTTTITVDGKATTITDTDTHNALESASLSGKTLTITGKDNDSVNVDLSSIDTDTKYTAGNGIAIDGNNGNAISVKLKEGENNLEVTEAGLELKKALTVNSVKAGDFYMSTAGIGYGGKAYITSSGLNANSQKITGVADGTIAEGSKDAVNGSQLHAVKETANKGWNLSTNGDKASTKVAPDATVDFSGDDNIKVSNTGKAVKVELNKELTGLTSVTTKNAYVTNVDASNNKSVTNVGYVNNQIAGVTLTEGKGISITDKKINVKLKDGEENLKVDETGLYLRKDLTGMESITGVGGGKISFSGGNVTINKITFNNDGRIQNVANGTENTDAVNFGQLQAVKNELIASDKDTHIDTSKEYNVGANNQIKLDVLDKDGKKLDQQVVINDVAKASDVGDVSKIADDLKNGGNKPTTVVDAVNNLNNKVGDLNYVEGGKGNYVTNGETTTTSIGKLDKALKDVADTAAKQHTTVSGSGNIVVEDPTTNTDGGKNYNVKLADNITVNSVTANTFKADQTVMDKDGLKVGDKVSVTATAVTAGKTSISDEGVKVGDKTYISADGLNANGQHITNVKAGEADTDAVNYGQLKDTNNRINGVENQVISNSNRINQLGNRVNKVGAGAAALAALHPMDFDPDDKLTFSAGYGNYGGENAAAIGAYYRPDEKVMFSVGGTVGNGENMVNAGVSFALDRTNHVSNSRTALAREVIDLRGQLAVMGAKMAKMEKALGMLDETKTKLFPDIPANHWAYEYIAKLAGNGYIEGYPDGNFGGDRLMTRYEFAAMLYRAIENGAALEEKIIKEFEPELGRIRVDRISGEDGDRDKIERVRVNDTKGERDHYGNKLAK